jgi:hypothetical protein
MDQPRYESFRNPLFRLAVAICLVVTAVFLLKDGCSSTGCVRVYTTNNPILPDNTGRELIQLALYLAAFVVALVMAVQHRKRRVFMIAFGLYFFFFAMEETDWLQQMFHYPTPAFFAERSTQNVVNLHNLVLFGGLIGGQLFARLLIAAPALVFGVVALVRARRGDFLSKAALAAVALTIILDFFPRHSVFQVLFGVFVVAYPLIVVSVDLEREQRAAAPDPPADPPQGQPTAD